MAEGAGSREVTHRLAVRALATIAFMAFLIVVNYPYALNWLPWKP